MLRCRRCAIVKRPNRMTRSIDDPSPCSGSARDLLTGQVVRNNYPGCYAGMEHGAEEQLTLA